METYFINLFEDVRHERSLILLLSLTDIKVYLKRAGFTDNEIEIIKNIALQKLERQTDLKNYIAMNLIEQFDSQYNK